MTQSPSKTSADKATVIKAPREASGAEPVDLGPPLRKKELVETITQQSGLKKSDVKLIVENTLSVLGEALRENRALILPPLGKVKAQRQKQVTGGRVVIARVRQNDRMPAQASLSKSPVNKPR
jgi:DNA-binding protein HU-alpha